MNQTEALNILKTGRNVFLTGEPGAGKTYILNQYIDWLQATGIKVSVTASTGIAATHIGGMTIHSWSGIGIKDVLTDRDLDKITSRERIVKRIDKTKVLVIDEISMLEGGLLEAVDRVVRRVKKTDTVFGGLQVVIVGDFFQLPPVVRGGEPFRFAWQSRSWEELDPTVCYLTEQYRHQDSVLTDLLRSIRLGELSDEHCRLLNARDECSLAGVEPTRLHTHNIDVDAVNNRRLKAIDGTPRVFTMTTRGNKQLVKGLIKNCLSPERLELKTGAVVMCTKNNFEAGYVNGTLAKVTSFGTDLGYPTVVTATGKKIVIKPTSWELRDDDKVLAEIAQLPLRLAWAITIHKSQGMSLDAAEIDLTKAFVYGHGYVALSRVRTLSGLKLTGMNSDALLVNPRVINEDKRFRSLSESATAIIKDLSEAEVSAKHKQFVSDCGGTMPKGKIKPSGRHKSDPRSPRPDTKTVTFRLLKAGKNLSQIARQRSLNLSTIWNHLEGLAESGDLTESDVGHLLPTGWAAIETVVSDCFTKQSDDKLKPVFLALGKKYSYDTIRLVRLFCRLTK